MKRNLAVTNFKSSFQSCDKDTETILRKIFVESRPYSDKLKKLMVVNTKDCLTNPKYDNIIQNFDLSRLVEEKYIRQVPKLSFNEHEEVKSYIILTFDNFMPTDNPEFRDCIVHIDVLCHTDYWDIGNYKVRPLQICGFIDSILNESKLSGIGTLNFLGCDLLLLGENLSGYTLTYTATHGSDDKITAEEAEIYSGQ